MKIDRYRICLPKLGNRTNKLSISTLRTFLDEHAQMETVQIMKKYFPIKFDETKELITKRKALEEEALKCHNLKKNFIK